ncbi:hypothetical protein LINPERHAP2_LOCUS43754 [Linum perenne]
MLLGGHSCCSFISLTKEAESTPSSFTCQGNGSLTLVNFLNLCSKIPVRYLLSIFILFF